MAGQCTTTFDDLARELGDFTCRHAPAVVGIRNPLGLSNWTLPVLELMMVIGAVLALIHSVRRLRRDGDPTNLALWFATVIYLFVIEIPLYFPNVFGISDEIGVVFVHNAFTVQFLFERLPLYIVALYPALITLAYDVVRRLGVFRDRGVIVGAICVGFVHLCLYEVFDQLGPQLRWWAWNPANPLNHPYLTSVPMTSVVIFAALGPIVVTLLVMVLVGRRAARGERVTGTSLTWRTIVVGASVPIGVAALSIPSSLFGGADPDTTAQAIVFSIDLVIVTAVAAPTLVGRWMALRCSPNPDATSGAYVGLFGPAYLAVMLVLWVTALPQYVGARDGVTDDGTPTGSLSYATLSFVVAALCVAAAVSADRTRDARPAVTV